MTKREPCQGSSRQAVKGWSSGAAELTQRLTVEWISTDHSPPLSRIGMLGGERDQARRYLDSLALECCKRQAITPSGKEVHARYSRGEPPFAAAGQRAGRTSSGEKVARASRSGTADRRACRWGKRRKSSVPQPWDRAGWRLKPFCVIFSFVSCVRSWQGEVRNLLCGSSACSGSFGQ